MARQMKALLEYAKADDIRASGVAKAALMLRVQLGLVILVKRFRAIGSDTSCREA